MKLLIAIVPVLLSGCMRGTSSVEFAASEVKVASVDFQKSESNLSICGGAPGMNLGPGDQIIVSGSGFTQAGNQVCTTDGMRDRPLEGNGIVSNGGTRLAFTLNTTICAPFGFGVAVVNSNGRDDNLHIPPGTSVTF